MNKDQIKQLQKALAVADIKAPQGAIAIPLELARAVKNDSRNLALGNRHKDQAGLFQRVNESRIPVPG